MRLGSLLALLVTLTVASPAAAQTSASLGRNPPGAAFYSVASGLSKIVTDAGAVTLTVQPCSGSSTFLPLLDSVLGALFIASEWTAPRPLARPLAVEKPS